MGDSLRGNTDKVPRIGRWTWDVDHLYVAFHCLTRRIRCIGITFPISDSDR